MPVKRCLNEETKTFALLKKQSKTWPTGTLIRIFEIYYKRINEPTHLKSKTDASAIPHYILNITLH